MNKLKLIGKFIGPLRIINLRDVKRKTYLSRDVVEVEFNDKTKKEYPIDDLEVIATEEAKDLSTLRQLEIQPVAKKILGILADSELPIYDPVGANVQYLLQTVLPDSIQANTKVAYGKLFGKDYHKITYLDIAHVLQKDEKSKPEKKDLNGTAS